ncbi:ATP synthase subunit F [Candidatus Epulonipiscium fishelsonii]|uniref:ATP synthase subunit F n=1 Tax=Candidatus Epulonipiscium fishelsonii TaxID=77094 RepID=A0ACC8XGA9_9FIRM|nr:ATP synthase subunit F [Epulopiscium sp. SCG-B05WGA-EpuloA1]ONI42488.1 ATP synthase subunit F [Epulopiscium sp. SCG-B11WGA-EpuloA1]
MKTFLISDNKDTWVGMRLVGIEGVVVHTRAEVLEMIKQVFKNDTIGLLILTENIMDLAHDEIMEMKLRKSKPLIIEIPDRHGTRRQGDTITQYIRNSVGIKI